MTNPSCWRTSHPLWPTQACIAWSASYSLRLVKRGGSDILAHTDGASSPEPRSRILELGGRSRWVLRTEFERGGMVMA